MRTALLALALAALPAAAQTDLRIHQAAPADARAPDGMRRAPVEALGGDEVWLGVAVLDLPASSVETVGTERDADGTRTLSLWLTEPAAAALAQLTAASVGRPLAVVFGRRVLAAPLVEGPVTNGLVRIDGLDAETVDALARSLREAAGVEDAPRVAPPPRSAPRVAPPERAETPSERATPPERPAPRPERPALTPEPAPPTTAAGAEAAGASAAALAFVEAVARRDWPAVADALHPASHQAARPGATEILRFDGPTTRVRDGDREGAFATADVLGRVPTVTRPGLLSDRDLAALYLAALDVLGTWGPPAPPRRVAGEVSDGDLVHVLLSPAVRPDGVSDVTVVTVRRDDAGRWRPLLTQAQGF